MNHNIVPIVNRIPDHDTQLLTLDKWEITFPTNYKLQAFDSPWNTFKHNL